MVKFLSIILLALSFYSCTCSNCDKRLENNIPAYIVEAADKFIISTAGQDFFDDFIYPDYVRTKAAPPYYHMYYVLRMVEMDYINEQVYFTLDEKGNIVEDFDIAGIPNCVEEPTECQFNITKEQAVDIALREKLAKGIKPWDTAFRWSSDLGKYVWHILSTTRELGSGEAYKASGQEIIVDPYDGKVLKFRDWDIF
ncbi:MAG: PepSY domain-containing protein [bacterium]